MAKKPLVKRIKEVISSAHVMIYLLLGWTLTLYFLIFQKNLMLFSLFLIYFLYCILDKKPSKGGNKKSFKTIRFVDDLIGMKHFCDYMDLDLIKEEDLIDGPSYLFCLHPHGVLGYSHYANFMSTYSKFYSLFPKISLRTCTINLNFKVPFARESFVLRGFISADKESINFSLNKKNNDASKINAVAIVIGGAKESELAIPNRNTLVLKNRKGFVKIAIQNGSSLVPVYSFQENNLYKQIENKTIKKIQNLFQKYTTFRPVLVYGRFGTLIPFRTKIVTVVGKPIKVAKNPNPTEEEINKYHKQYILGVREIFDKYKDLYAKDRTEDLIII